MTIYAKCENPKVDYLTDGKPYEVKREEAGGHKIIDDNGDLKWHYWEASPTATWTRIDDSDPPQWALDKAADGAGYTSWRSAKKASPDAKESIEAHAATLAKYETEPVDPVDLEARRLLMDHGIWGCDLSEESHRNFVKVVSAALRLPAMGDDK